MSTSTSHTEPAAPVREVFAGNEFTWHVATDELSLAEVVAQRGGEPALHVHAREDETYVVLDGEVTFQRGDERFDVEAGAVVCLPRGVEHGFALRSARARLLVICTPGGLDVPFHALSEPVLGDAPPAAPTGPPPPEAISAMEVAFGAYGVTFTGPPLPALLDIETAG